MKKNYYAFTLVELIVVISILAILGTIAFITLGGYSRDARDNIRISDISIMKTSLELYQLDSGKYPIPTDGIDITYSGSTVWNQGSFGETVHANLSKLNKIPLDPSTNKEYTYSITMNKNEYEVSGILEGDEISMNSEKPHPSPLLRGEGIVGVNKKEISYNPSSPLRRGAVGEVGLGELRRVSAGTTEAIAYVTGNYNGLMTKSLSGTICNVLSLPTIITNDTSITDLQQIITEKRFVYNGYKNLPSTFRGSKFKQNGGFDFAPAKIIAYSDTGSCSELINNNDYSARLELLKGLQDSYSGTILVDKGKIKDLGLLDINISTPSNDVINYAGNFVNNNLGGNIIINNNVSNNNVTNTQNLNQVQCNYGEVVQGGVCIDPNWDKVGILLKYEGVNNSKVLKDEKGSNSLQTGGDLGVISTAKSKFGSSSMSFSGTTDSMYFQYNNSFYDLSTQDFTIEGWINVSSYTGRTIYGSILSKKVDGTDFDYSLYVNGNNKSIVFAYGTTSIPIVYMSSPSNTIQLNTWYHVAVSRQGSNIRMFIDGNLVNTNSITENIRNRNLQIYMGISGSSQTQDYHGYVDELRFTKGISRYNSNFPVPVNSFATGSNEALLMHFDGLNGTTIYVDEYGHNFSNFGTAKNTNLQSKFGGGSLYTNGTLGYITSTHQDYLIGSQPFTFEFWVYVNSLSSSGYGIPILNFGNGAEGNNGFAVYYFYRNTPQNSMYVRNGATQIVGFNNVNISQWHHIVVQRDTPNGGVRMFLNGVSTGYLPYSGSFLNNNTIVLGKYDGSWLQNRVVYIDEVRFTRGIARYSSNFTPPQSPY
ncbi:MAG: LamG-like jellyroll fold domain-containing protein [Candidatus Gracilibacteria bacterium]|nr:LamG-like jellyroll fold domain-containing protein [Candidatus Gracilibacteria bacterium]